MKDRTPPRKGPRCKGIVKASWHSPEHPCKLPAFKDGFCRWHHPDKLPPKISPAGACAKCQAVIAENDHLRSEITRVWGALGRAGHQLRKSRVHFNDACDIINNALKL